MKADITNRLNAEFGDPSRDVIKVRSWKIAENVGVVLQLDQPTREDAAYIWLPHPGDRQSIPEAAVEYPAEAGRHSDTYPAPGLKKGEPAMKITIHDAQEINDLVVYIHALAAKKLLPEMNTSVMATRSSASAPAVENPGHHKSGFINPATMPTPKPVKPRREAIPRLVQREVWQRDGGQCVECSTRERLCFDHIVPFSRGGTNTVRNIQLLCERCNLSKSNQI